MSIQLENYYRIKEELKSFNADLIAVSKTKPVSDLQTLYDIGERNFGENYVQELVEKQPQFREDMKWHFIGHLQSNKVKQIAEFVYLIHGVDSHNLAKEVSKNGNKLKSKIKILLQISIAEETTKFGLNEKEADEILDEYNQGNLSGIAIHGLMGMATFTDDQLKIANEFSTLNKLFISYKKIFPEFNTLSMGMTSDYKIALEHGSTMIRIGSAIFGERNYNK